MITLSDRNEYVAAHLTKPVKETLKRIAIKRRTSVSKFISDAVTEKLEREVGDILESLDEPK